MLMVGRVRVFRTTSQVWQMQMWRPEEGKYVRESLRTDDEREAIREAEKRYINYRAKIQSGEKVFSVTATEMRDRFLAHIEKMVEARQMSKGRASNIATYTKHYLDFIGRATKVQNVDRRKFRDYLAFRRSKKTDILATVVVNESSTIKQMYRFAVDEGLIDRFYAPDFGVIKKNDEEGTREAYTPIEYNQLISVSKGWYKRKDAATDEARYYRRLIHDFILVMANGGFRTQEARLLRWVEVAPQIRTLG